MQSVKPFKYAFLPSPPRFTRILGPSFILLGLGLGSGEIILWPYLVSNYGFGIIWAAVLGILFQFFINMEIERYAIIRGESIFVGFARLFRYLPIWFIASTFIGFGWPGIIAASAQLFSKTIGVSNFQLVAIGLLLLIGIILTFGPVLYRTVERFQKILIFTGVPLVFLLAILLAKSTDYLVLSKGLVGIGDGYFFLPAGISLLTFLGAFAFAGAGGNLNLAQSYYVKEKGYGMGKYAGKIQSLVTGRKEEIEFSGTTFEINQTNLQHFKKWWKLINFEHFIIFFLTGTASILFLALLSYATSFGAAGNLTGINFIFNESAQIASRLGNIVSVGFLLLLGLMLFGTQFTVLDSTSRIISENVLLLSGSQTANRLIAKAYYITLWLQILFGICVFLLGFSDPRTLVVTAAVINAVTMFVHIGLTYLLNTKTLPREISMTLPKRALILFIFAFFGFFSFYSLWANFLK